MKRSACISRHSHKPRITYRERARDWTVIAFLTSNRNGCKWFCSFRTDSDGGRYLGSHLMMRILSGRHGRHAYGSTVNSLEQRLQSSHGHPEDFLSPYRNLMRSSIVSYFQFSITSVPAYVTDQSIYLIHRFTICCCTTFTYSATMSLDSLPVLLTIGFSTLVIFKLIRGLQVLKLISSVTIANIPNV